MGSDWEVRDEGDIDDVSCLLGDAAPAAVVAGGDVELRVARLELLIDRRALLLSGVLLRQNPHNVAEVRRLRCEGALAALTPSSRCSGTNASSSSPRAATRLQSS